MNVHAESNMGTTTTTVDIAPIAAGTTGVPADRPGGAALMLSAVDRTGAERSVPA